MHIDIGIDFDKRSIYIVIFYIILQLNLLKVTKIILIKKNINKIVTNP